MSDYSHVFRIGLGVILLVLAGWWAPRWWRPESYGESGPYRTESLSENMQREFTFQGRQSCRPCHPEILQTHQKDVHVTVPCEDCHNAADKHNAFHQGTAEIPNVNQAILDREFAQANCVVCHLKLTARPTSFPQVDPDRHLNFHHVTAENTFCTACHNPHEPLFLITSFDQAKIHPLVNQCRDCHDTPPEKNYTAAPNHPAIITCQKCHPNLVSDYNQRPHAYLPCGACHQLKQKNETSARINRRNSKMFCLMCHENPDHLNRDLVPQIVLIEHLPEKAQIRGLDLENLETNKTACLLCHIDTIHDQNLFKQPPENIR